MFCWRITKYNPTYRDKKGAYLRDEWTAYSDIGRTYNNKKITFDDYIKVEDAYIASIISFMELTKTEGLSIVGLESRGLPERDTHYSRDMVDAFVKAKEGLLLDRQLVRLIARLILREDLWCKLKAENMYVHFGYDYYMYIGSSKYSEEVIKKIEKSGLFVEEFKSPYSDDEDEECIN